MLLFIVSALTAETITVVNGDFELPELSYNLFIFDANGWYQVPGFTGGPYSTPASQRAGESGLQKKAGVTGNAAYGNSNSGNIYQLLGKKYQEGVTYGLHASARNSWCAETASAEFYYLPDELNPLDRVTLAVQTVTLDDGSNTDHSYKDIELEFVAQASQPYIGKYIGIQFSGQGTGDRSDPGRAWWNIDDVSAYSSFLTDPYPADGAENLSTDITLSWSSPSSSPIEYNVYIGTASDPNFTLVSYQQTETSYTPAVPLEYDTEYVWKVDVDDPNFLGQIWSFTTAPKTPTIVDQPESVAVFVGDNVEFGVTVYNDLPLTYSWYQSIDNTTDTFADDTLVQAGAADNLEISSVVIADEGYYYCIADDSNTVPAISDTASLLIQRQLSRYQFEDDIADTNGNYDLALSGGCAYVPGPNSLGSAIELDGEDDYVYVDMPEVDCFAGYSVTMWAKASSLGQSQHAAVVHVNPLFQIDLDATGTKYCYYNSTSKELGDISTNEWSFIAVVSDGATVSLYFNGLLVDTASQRQNVMTRLGVGVDRDLSIETAFAGAVDDVQVYTYPLDKYQVYDLYYDVVPVPGCLDPLEFDLSGPDSAPDCIVNIYDFIAFSQYWLSSGLYPPQ